MCVWRIRLLSKAVTLSELLYNIFSIQLFSENPPTHPFPKLSYLCVHKNSRWVFCVIKVLYPIPRTVKFWTWQCKKAYPPTTSHSRKLGAQLKQTLQNHSTLKLKSISRDGTIRDNLAEALPCCSILETGPKFDLLKGHITAWLKEPWDAKMTPPPFDTGH